MGGAGVALGVIRKPVADHEVGVAIVVDVACSACGGDLRAGGAVINQFGVAFEEIFALVEFLAGEKESSATRVALGGDAGGVDDHEFRGTIFVHVAHNGDEVSESGAGGALDGEGGLAAFDFLDRKSVV